jgi:hypothetical protein
MVRAYLMYGFPTQTAQETIDALDMCKAIVQSGRFTFWLLAPVCDDWPIAP